MSDVRHLVQDLRAHAHEVPAHIGKVMREAAAELEQRAVASIADVATRLSGKHRRPSLDLDAAVLPPPFPPPVAEKEETCA